MNTGRTSNGVRPVLMWDQVLNEIIHSLNVMVQSDVDTGVLTLGGR